MGNGATFAIETLIFAALSFATGSKRFSVYGDDIIIEKEYVEDLFTLLKFFGFRINEDKSFTEGPFRESCGVDVFSGEEVTPFYLRCEKTVKPELCHIVNGLASLSSVGVQLEKYLYELVHEEKLPLVPFNDSSISGVWVTPSDAYRLKLIHNHDYVLRFKAFVPRTKKRKVVDSRTLFLWHLDASRRKAGIPIDRSFHPFYSYSSRKNLVREVSSQCIIRSSVPLFSHKFVRTWVCWNPPAAATPVHLYRWTELIVPDRPDD
jgi:hypothetical protein